MTPRSSLSRPVGGPSGSIGAAWRVAALAVAGVAIGHLLVYAAVLPDAAVRDAFLARTGHGYFPAFVDAAVTIGAVALMGSVLGSLVRSSSPAARPRALFVRLAVAQSASFVVLEAVERLVSGSSFADLVHGDLLAGIAVQVLVAAAIALVASILRRAVQRAASLERLSDRPPRGVAALAIGASSPVAARLPRRSGARAPPLLALGC